MTPPDKQPHALPSNGLKSNLRHLIRRHIGSGVKFHPPSHSRDASGAHKGHQRDRSHAEQEQHKSRSEHGGYSNLARRVADAVRVGRRKKGKNLARDGDGGRSSGTATPGEENADEEGWWNEHEEDGWSASAPLEDMLKRLRGTSSGPLPPLVVTGTSRRNSNADEYEYDSIDGARADDALLKQVNRRHRKRGNRDQESSAVSTFVSGVSATLYATTVGIPLALLNRIVLLLQTVLSPITNRLLPPSTIKAASVRETLVATRARISTNMEWFGFLSSSAFTVLKRMGPKKIAVAVGKEVAEKTEDGAKAVAKVVGGRKAEKWVHKVGKVIGGTPIEIHLFYGSLIAITVWRLKAWSSATQSRI